MQNLFVKAWGRAFLVLWVGMISSCPDFSKEKPNAVVPGNPVLIEQANLPMRASKPMEPGYSGTMPSAEARRILKELDGACFYDSGGDFDGGEWEVLGFSVTLNPGKAKGPYLRIKNGERIEYLPMESDGDVVDIYQRITGRVPQGIQGVKSVTYESIFSRRSKRFLRTRRQP